jgi:hypothetical protein
MVAIILLIIGSVLVSVGFVTFFTIGRSGAQSAANSFGIDLGGTLLLPSLIPWIIGGLLILWAVVLLFMGKARQKELKEIAASGIDTAGIITFLDRNYAVLINNRPVYSIVEYRFRDNHGREWANRAGNIDTELVIRTGWQVGSPIRVRYMPSDPTKSAIVGVELSSGMAVIAR